MTDNDILRLVGRKPIQTSIEELSYYQGKIVAITGGAGTIGSGLVRKLLKLNPKQIIVIDWWENGIFYLQQELQNSDIIYKICDTKSRGLGRIFKKYRPDIVIHASAYKHLPLMQENPIEAFNNNVYGTYNCIKYAIENKVKNFILVSTDKAVNTTSVMGATKRLCEMLVESQNCETIFNAVRFGNVLRSNGSVVNTFIDRIKRKQNLNVTSDRIKRYFMSIDEATDLILLSGTIAKNSEIFLFDMGEPILIIELARKLIKAMRSKVGIDIIGLRRGEKMFEELSFNPESMERTSEGRIFRVKNEKVSKGTIKAIEKIFNKTLKFELDDIEMNCFIRNLGFNIKK